MSNGLVFPNAVGKPLRRTLFRSRLWRPALVRAGLLGEVTERDGHRFEGRWTDDDGIAGSDCFESYGEAVKAVAARAGGGLRYHDLRHWYATWLVDDGVPPNMVQRVMDHENMTTTLQIYTRRTEHHDRILDALGAGPATPDEPVDQTDGSHKHDDPDGDEDGPAGSLAMVRVRVDVPEKFPMERKRPGPWVGFRACDLRVGDTGIEPVTSSV